MSDNLGFGRIPEQIEQPEIAANDAFGKIDSFFSTSLDLDLTSDLTLTVEQSQTALLVRVKNCKVDGRLLTLPATRRLYFIDLSDASNTQSLTVAKGATSVKIPIGVKSDLYSASGADALTLIASGGTGGGGTDPGNGGGGVNPQIVQYTLDDDVYGTTTFPAAPTPGNIMILFYDPYINYYDLSAGWNRLVFNGTAAADSAGIAWKIVPAGQGAEVATYGSPRPEGSCVLFEISGVDETNIDQYGVVVESNPPSVSTTFTPNGAKSLVVGLAVPSGSSGFYPLSMAGADILGTFAQQGDRDNITTGRSPAAFSKVFSGSDPYTLTATYSGDNTSKLNLSFLSFKLADKPNAAIPDPEGNNGKFLGVAANKYALLSPPSGGGGGGGDSYRAPVSIFASVQNTQIGNSPTIRYSRGVTSMIKRSDGVYRITFETPFTDNYYVFEGGCRHEQDGGSLVDAHLSIDRRSSPNSGKNPEWIDVVATYQGAGIYDPKILEIWLRCMPNDYY